MLVFLERCRVENASYIALDQNRPDLLVLFCNRLPVEWVDILQNGQNTLVGQLLLSERVANGWAQGQITKQDKYHGFGVTFTNSRDFVDGMAVARSNSAQVLAWHTIKPVYGITVIAGGAQETKNRVPVIYPVSGSSQIIALAVSEKLNSSK